MNKIRFAKWNASIDGINSKDFWNSVDWKGNTLKRETVRPSNDELALHFEKLYSSELAKIEDLSTDTYDQILDDPITKVEMDDAAKEMKKGGFDYNLLTY